MSLVRVEVLAGRSHGVEPDGGGDEHAAGRPLEPAARPEVLLHLVYQEHLGAVDASDCSMLPSLQREKNEYTMSLHVIDFVSHCVLSETVS